MSVHMYTVQHDSREFSPIPDVYWPERWLTQDQFILPTGEIIGAEQVITHRGSLLPFSLGPQNCAGKSLAIMEVRAVLCALVQRFDMQAAKGSSDLENWEKNVHDMYVTTRGPLKVNLQAVQH